MGGEATDEAEPCRGDVAGERSERGDEKTEPMAPWEQHSKVISIPRFDYRAPSSLLQRSHSGFLITCPIKREKSATKEAISILDEYIDCMYSDDLGTLEPSCTDVSLKKRKLCFKEMGAKYIGTPETNDTADILEDSVQVRTEAGVPSSETDVNAHCALSLVKLTRSGLLLFMFPNNNFHRTVKMLSNITLSLGSGTRKPPLWCHRIFPIQETCILIEKDLQNAVSKLILEYFGNEKDKFERPIKFAVGFNRRGIDESRIKKPKSTVQDSKELSVLDRDKCFEAVAGAVKAIATNASVDLRSPELVVLVELLPISGVPPGSPVVGVSVLPIDLVTTKPRLCVKHLVSDSKTTKNDQLG